MIEGKVVSLHRGFVVMLAFAMSACASVTGSNSQPISFETRTAEGSLSGAFCELENPKGKWFVTTPGSVTVRKAAEDLLVTCKKKGFETAFSKVASGTNAGMYGNILAGGVVGAVVDHSTGAAYDYPTLILIDMQIDPSSQTLINGNNISSDAVGENGMGSQEALEKCKKLGFKFGTREYGLCVMKIAK